MYQTSNISQAEYKVLKARYDNYERECAAVCKSQTCITVEEQALLPAPLTHEQISSLEVYEFRNDPPQRYFAYVHLTDYKVSQTIVKEPTHITTWTGELLGKITERGIRYRSNLGDERINIKVQAINGRTYSGVYYKSSGDYCRLKACK